MPDQGGWNVVSSEPLPQTAPPVKGGWNVVSSQADAPVQAAPAGSGDLPHPDLVAQQTSVHANTLANILARDASAHTSALMAMDPPPVPAPPVPGALQTEDQTRESAPTWINPRTGQRAKMLPPGQEGGPLGVLDMPQTGITRMGQGVDQMAQPQMREKAEGLHKVVSGAFEAATPLMVGAGAVAPAATAGTLAATTAAQAGTEAVLKKIGIPEEYAQVAGDLVGLFAGAKTPKTIDALRAKYEPVLKARFEKANAAAPSAPEVSANSTGAEPYRPAQEPAQPVAAPAAGPGWNVVKSEPLPKEESRAEPRTTLRLGIATGLDAKLPSALRGAKPRYSYGAKQFELSFDSDLDRAAYITGQTKLSKADASYLKFAMDATGESENAVRQYGRDVRAAIKLQAGDAAPGSTLTVPDMARERFGKPQAPIQRTIEQPGANDGKQPAPTAGVDTGAALPLDAGRTGEGPAVHGEPASGKGPHAGEATDVIVPGEERSIPARYELRELSDIQPSHNGQTFLPNPKYQGHNERDYSKPENQGRVIDQSSEEKFNPRYHITDNPDMVNGPALIDEDGNALGGNDRTMHLQRVYGRDAGKAAEYRALLEKKAPQFGIDPEAVRGMRQPVLVRVATPEGLESLPGGAKWAVRKTNIAGTAALSSSERAAADAGQMSPEMTQHIAGAIEDAGPDATLNDALTGRSGTVIVNRLIADGFFSEQERPGLMDGKTGVLTQAAKDRISKALLGKFFRDSDQIARTPASIRNKLERVAAPLAKVAGNPEWDITPEVREAIDLIEYAGAHGIRNLGDVVSQTRMFGEAPKWSDGAVKVAEMLRDGKPNEVVSAFRKYVNSKEPNMFGESTPAQAFRDAFGAEKPEPAATPAPEPETGPRGPVLRQFHHDAAGAIAELRTRQSGDAIGALNHPGIGDVDLVWGQPGTESKGFEDGSGIAKLVAKGREDILRELPEFFPKMRVDEARSGPNRIRLVDDKRHAVVRLDYDGEPKRWLLTAFDDEAPTSGRRTGVPGNPKAGGTPPPIGAHESDTSAGRAIDVPGTHATERQSPPPGGSGPSVADKPADIPPDKAIDTGPVYIGSGFGALEPLFREAKAEGDRLRAARNEALAAAKAARTNREQMKAGEKARAYLTSERDLWAARTNQALDIVKRKVLPKIQDREALGIAREFRHHPLELQAYIDGTHPALDEVDGGALAGQKNIERLLPLLKQAQRILAKPTARERAADAAFTNIAERDLQEGRAGGWLESRWLSDEYVPHVLNPKGEGDVAKAPSTTGRAMGKIGKYFGFGERRTYPTTVQAVAEGVIPRTLDPAAAFVVHADQFARARATHLFEAYLVDSGLGKWGDGSNAPEGWKQLADHTDEFKKRQAHAVPGSFDPESRESELEVSKTGLYVKPFIADALAAITDPDYMARLPGFAKARTAQRGLKEAILGLSGFHLLTENVMAATDIGPSGMYRAFREPLESPATLANERDLIASGGTTAIQGSVMDAYRGMRPGTIPTRAEVVRAYLPGTQQALEVADSITRFTFDNVQRRFKVWAFALHRDAWIHDNPLATSEQLAEAKKGIASYVNGVYGGLHWENMGWSRAMVEVSRFFMLAPDWATSNVALGKYAFDAPVSSNELPFRRQLAGATTKESAQARLSRAFWTKQIVGGLVATQMLSLMLSWHLSRRPFQVYLGKDKNGADVYQNLVFRGSAGDLVSWGTKMEDHGILVGTGVFAGSKAAPFTKAAIHAVTGRDDLGRETAPKNMNWLAKNVRSMFSVATDISPVPIVARSIYRTTMGDQSDKFLWSERILSLFGPAAQHVAPDGTHMTPRGLRPNAVREEKSAAEQKETGRVYRRRYGR